MDDSRNINYISIYDFKVKPDLMAPSWILQKQQENPFLCAAQELG